MNQIDKIMEQAQVFASAWALAGGRFDSGDGFEVAEQEKQALRAAIEQALAVQPKQKPVNLETIEQYRMQMAGISTAAIGYWKEGDGIHPDYDTVALRDVAKLYAKYDEFYKKVHAPQPQPKQEPVAYITRNEEGDPSMLFFDHLEAEPYCAEDEDPEPLYATPHPHLKAMQQALEALEQVTRHFTRSPSTLADTEARIKAHKAINALREVLQATATEYQQAADKMAMEHKIERDRWIPMFDALQEESQALRQQLAEAQRDTAKQIADAAFRHGLSLVKTDTGFELLRLGTAISSMKGAA